MSDTYIDPTTGLPVIDFGGCPRLLAKLPPRPDRSGLKRFRDAVPMVPKSEYREINRRGYFDVKYLIDQRSHGACCGFGSVGAFMRARVLSGQTFQKLSGAFVYSFVNGGQDQGAVIHDTLAALQSHGTCLETEAPWDAIYPSRYPASAKETAKRFRLDEAYTADTFEEIMSGLQLGFMAVLAVMVGSTFTRLSSEGVCGYDRGPGNHCLTPDTIIASRQMKTADQVKEDDLIFGHDGKEHRVTEVITRYFNGSLARIQALGTPPLTVTEDHPVLVYRRATTPAAVAATAGYTLPADGGRVTINGWKAHEPAWVRAGDVRPGDYLVTPKVETQESADPEWDFFVGYYCGNGSLIVEKGRGVKGVHVELAMGGPIDRVESVMARFGNVKRIWRRKNGELCSEAEATSLRLRLSSKAFAEMMLGLVGRRSSGKRLPALNPTMLAGLLSADGCERDGRVKFTTTSKVLAQQVRLLASSLGHRAALRPLKVSKGQYANARPSWGVSWRKGSLARAMNLTEDGANLTLVKSVMFLPYTGPVFNYEVEDAQSFIADTVAVHNCVHGDGARNLPQAGWVIDMPNSWGQSFGQNGRGYLTEKHIDGVEQDCYLIRTATVDPQDPNNPPAAI